MMHVQSTYKRHVEECRAYRFLPMSYETWLSWRVNKRIKDLTEADRLAHPKES